METVRLNTDILVIGGGTAGCWAAITIAEQSGLDVLICEKAGIKRSGCLAAGVNALNAYITEGKTPQDYADYCEKDAAGIVRGDLLLTMSERLNSVTEKLERLGLVDFFDAIYISSDCGIAKPEAAFMQKLMEEQHLAADDCVMVGNDWRSDMAVAAKCGVDGIFLNTGRYREAEIRAGLPKGRFHVIQSGDIAELIS